MNIKDEHIDSVCSLLDQLVGNVSFKNLFTGYGLFHKQGRDNVCYLAK